MPYTTIVEDWKLKSPEVRHHYLLDIFLLRYIYNTNSLEGIALDYNQTRELFESEVVSQYNGDVRDLFSVLNSRNTFKLLLELLGKKEHISKEVIIQLHKTAMYASIDSRSYNINSERPGMFKQKMYVIGKNDTGAEPEDVELRIDQLIEFIEENEGKDPLKVASALHAEFESIHPFSDGNGRVGRWLANYYLMLHDHPPFIVFNTDKKQYYKALESFDEEDTPVELYHFLKEQIIKTWEISKPSITKLEKTSEFLN